MIQSPIDLVTGQATGLGRRRAGRRPGRAGPWCCSCSAASCSPGPPGSWWSRVADTAVTAPRTAEPTVPAAYRALVRSRVAAQASYRASFAVERRHADVRSCVVEFVEIYVDLPPGGRARRLRLRRGRADVRPGDRGLRHRRPASSGTSTGCRSTCAPASSTRSCCARCRPSASSSPATSRCAGSAGSATGLVVLAIALTVVDIDWTPARVALLVITPSPGRSSSARSSSRPRAIGFWLVEGMEFANAFTYGGNYLSSFPFTIFGTAMRRFFTFVVPAAFVAYLPTLALLGRDDPAGLPSWLSWCALPAALLVGRRGRPGLADRAAALRRERARDVVDGAGPAARVRRTPEGRPAAPHQGRGRRRRRGLVRASSPASASATSAPTARASRRPSRCSPASWCRPPGRCGSAASTRCGSAPRWPAGSAWSSGSAASCGGTCRCASRSGCSPRSTGCRRRPGSRGSTSASRCSRWSRSSTPRCASCRSASGCAARSPRPCCTPPSCWCSTSRPSASTC